ncbi:DUF4403 family protein [Aequorivita capsosiphonis]|uniref:DUF4403 family protein n=1 Tax=Aequorivita capsosiphonis TaxID=487317 RepID=UPI000418F67F|nr:DUF4403 family protein [Aequorivita capsosiphonis]
MNSNPSKPDQDISLTLPVRIGLGTIEPFLKKKFNGTTISKTDAKGKASNYFKILDLNLAESDVETYNVELRLQLETLTRIFNKKVIEVMVQADLRLDVEAQKLYVEAYKINSSGESWFANTILNSVLNTFIYKKFIKSLHLDLMPIIKEKLDLVNAKLTSKMEATKNISIMGNVEDFTLKHFKIKKDEVWVLVHTEGWCVIAIEDLEF